MKNAVKSRIGHLAAQWMILSGLFLFYSESALSSPLFNCRNIWGTPKAQSLADRHMSFRRRILERFSPIFNDRTQAIRRILADPLAQQEIIRDARGLNLLPVTSGEETAQAFFDPTDPRALASAILHENTLFVEMDNYPHDRGIDEYAQILFRAIHPGGRKNYMSRISPGHLLDLGSGIFQFIREMDAVYGRTGDFKFTGVSLSKLSHEEKNALFRQPNISAFLERKYEEISVSEIIKKFGKVDFAVDVYGVFSYTRNLPWVIKKTWEALKVGGSMVARGYVTEIELSDGRKVSLNEFLKKVSGLSVIDSGFEWFIAEKTAEPFRMPDLEFSHVDAESIPFKVFYRERRP